MKKRSLLLIMMIGILLLTGCTSNQSASSKNNAKYDNKESSSKDTTDENDSKESNLEDVPDEKENSQDSVTSKEENKINKEEVINKTENNVNQESKQYDSISCRLEKNLDSYKLSSEYEITYDNNNNVVKVFTNEVLTSDDEKILDTFETAVKTQLDIFKDLKYYNYEIKRSKGKLLQTTTIDYSKIDINKFIAINSDISSMFTDGKLKLDTIISIYEELDAVCKK